MNIEVDKSQLGIVVVGYNRLASISRLLQSLLNADYPSQSVPLVISIDCSNNQSLYKYVNDFEWPFGPKYLNIQTVKLGLKDHIFKCCALTKYFKGIILLEDDIIVARDFYNFATQAVDYYGQDSRVAQISLYQLEMNGFCGMPFTPLRNEFHVYASQSVSSWGECWTEDMWNSFNTWYINTDIDWDKIDMPKEIKMWSRAWSKYYYAYIIANNKFSIYPYTSLTTNFSEAGVHSGQNTTSVQVSLQQGLCNYQFGPFENLIHYDVFGCNLGIFDCCGISPSELCLDLYGNRLNINHKHYLLSCNSYPYEVIKSFGLCMRPHELNIYYNLSGEQLFLYDTTVKASAPKIKNHVRFLYYLHGFNSRALFKVTFYNILQYIKNRFKGHV